ncbi:MAG TPA: 1-(5-phosphoribosyl)-5-[(5-phosphoribosylamino)methylideneamino]imidazole-4-carboxamide isomerase [Nitrososphaerales archaeon]
MKIIPSIDIFKGKVVRLVKGDPKKITIYSDNPVEIAEKWKIQGAEMIHVVDLDSALGTGIDNHPEILRIVKKTKIPIQVGGGIRSYKFASTLLEKGVARVVVGTVAFRNPKELDKMIQVFGKDKVTVALDYVAEKVVIKGWTQSTGIILKDAISKLQERGVEVFLLTAVERDGMLSGPDHKTLSSIVKTQNAKVIASGGVTSIKDLIRLKKSGLFGAIIGKALYEEKISLEEAISTLR